MCVGILTQIGDTGGAYFTGAIAIHTFNTLVLRNKLPVWICLAVSVFGWLVAILMGERTSQTAYARAYLIWPYSATAATPTWIHNPVLGPIYGLNGLSCGIAGNWSILNTLLHLLPVSTIAEKPRASRTDCGRRFFLGRSSPLSSSRWSSSCYGVP